MGLGVMDPTSVRTSGAEPAAVDAGHDAVGDCALPSCSSVPCTASALRPGDLGRQLPQENTFGLVLFFDLRLRARTRGFGGADFAVFVVGRLLLLSLRTHRRSYGLDEFDTTLSLERFPVDLEIGSWIVPHHSVEVIEGRQKVGSRVHLAAYRRTRAVSIPPGRRSPKQSRSS